jgi:hypothetical protein
MPAAVTWILAAFWAVMACRQLQRGDMVLAILFAVVGVALTVYRLRAAK